MSTNFQGSRPTGPPCFHPADWPPHDALQWRSILAESPTQTFISPQAWCVVLTLQDYPLLFDTLVSILHETGSLWSGQDLLPVIVVLPFQQPLPPWYRNVGRSRLEPLVQQWWGWLIHSTSLRSPGSSHITPNQSHALNITISTNRNIFLIFLIITKSVSYGCCWGFNLFPHMSHHAIHTQIFQKKTPV